MAKEVGPGEFFDLIFGNAPDGGYVALATYPRGGIFDPSPGVGPTKQLWFSWPQERNGLVLTVSKNKHADLYVSPVIYKDKDKGRTKENALWVGVNYADADQASPEKFRIRPTVSVETSPGRYHLYWLLANPGTPEEVAENSRNIAYVHKDEGCDTSGWNLGKLLRVPSTRNNKPGLDQPFTVTAHSDGTMYTSEDILDAYPQDGSAPLKVHTGSMPMELPSYDEALSAVAHLKEVTELLHVKGRAPAKGRQGNRSQLMWLLLRKMAEAQIPKSVALVLAWEVAYCKTRIKGRHKTEFWREVCKAYEDSGVDEVGEPKIPVKREERPLALEMLTHSEREAVPPTILDHYVGWAATKTDAVRQYHEATFLTVLSCVFGEYGRPSVKYESGFLNTWFMVLGGTTKSRKSTVRKMMTRLLRQISDNQFFYDLGSNVTPEGLHNELLKRDGLSSLYHRDEVHGLFSEQKHKHYLAGLQEMMTELYDGTVQGKLRATGDVTSSQPADTCFAMYMTGVTEHVTESLTLNDFASGHLARFMYVHADPPPTTRESTQIEQSEEVLDDNGLYVEQEDRAYELILQQLRTAREWWGSKVPRGQQVKIFWEKDAWSRLNDVRYKALLWANQHRHKSVIEPTIERTLHAMLKIATLLAMAEMQPKVQMRHLLRAMKFTEQCITHLVFVVNRVASTTRSKLLEDILLAVSKNGNRGITQNSLYNQFKDACTLNEFSPLVKDLKAAGELKVVNNKVYISESV